MIGLGSQEVAYALRIDRRAKSIRLRLDSDGRLLLTIPSRFHLRRAESFIAEKADWIAKRINEAQRQERGPFSLPGPEKEYRECKELAERIILDCVGEMNGLYGFSYSGIAVRNQRSRWGSCSSKGRLSYSYRIAFLPKRYREYVVVHELCHLKEFNHSVRFWSLVEQAVPDHASVRREMRRGIRAVG